ncbi:hypothetical protein LUZ61_016572 [Rhynchospora tenuis]|uniref:Uncharacterized protein n=1 Tax=Rhynchospora tenuis TaxID=198213 RepID=A0AAD6EK83_9POAL|nr:hypothetical protein LUZ61_016572 [Rhynchospora tenuis]
MAPAPLSITKPWPCWFNMKVAVAPQNTKLSLSLRSSPLSLSLHRSPPSPLHCSYFDLLQQQQQQQQQQAPVVNYPRPEEISWSQELANSVNLIGTVAKPVQIKHLPTTGNSVAWTRLAVYKSSTQTTWVNLTFWNELAHVAYQHLETGRRIFVSGRLVSDDFKEGNNSLLYYKVVVKKLNFVQTRSSPVSFYDPRMAQNSPGLVEQRWQAFFANPLDWWDNRNNKKNPNAPDFKHKDTGEALWISSKYIPPWVNSQIEILDSKMASLQDNGRSSAVSFTDVTGLQLTPH